MKDLFYGLYLLRHSPGFLCPAFAPFSLIYLLLFFFSLSLITSLYSLSSLALTADPLLHHGSLGRRTDHFGVNSWREDRFDSW